MERLWALACYDVRLSTDQFYSLTLGQLIRCSAATNGRLRNGNF